MKNIKKTLSVISNEFWKNSEKSTLVPKSKSESTVILRIYPKNPFKSILMKIKLLEKNILGNYSTNDFQLKTLLSWIPDFSRMTKKTKKSNSFLNSLKTKDYKPKTTSNSISYKLLAFSSKQAFTLVELIVVITILAILGTISFISFNSYSSSARDSVRISDITNTKKALELFNIKAWSYPLPDNSITLSWWVNNTWSIIYQWILSDNVARNIWLSKVVVDPLTKNNYTYSTFSNWLYYQIASSLENNDWITWYNNNKLPLPLGEGWGEGNKAIALDNTFASDTFTTTKVEWNYKMDPSLPSLIVVKDSVNTNSWIFDPSVCFVINWWVNTLTSNSWSCQKKSEMNLKDFDDSLVGYWDMETTFNSWGKIWIKDNSWYWNDVFGSGITVKYETWWLINKAIEFNWEWLSQTWYYESEKMMWNIFNESLTMSLIFRKNNVFEIKYQKLILIWTWVTKDNFFAWIS